ncbi:MAG: hypothetical protein ACRDRL_15745 [Sciscionella sp.]
MSGYEVSGEFERETGEIVSGRFVTPPGLAHRLGISYRTVMKHIEAEHIEVVRLSNRRVLIRPREATRVVKAYRRDPDSTKSADWVPRKRRGSSATKDV